MQEHEEHTPSRPDAAPREDVDDLIFRATRAGLPATVENRPPSGGFLASGKPFALYIAGFFGYNMRAILWK